MNVKNRVIFSEKGQVLPILVIGVLVIVMMAALLIDGGVLFANRRQAQAAADAGALAGARETCYPTGLDPIEVAKGYAIDNGADNDVSAEYGINNKSIKVSVSVTNPSFFAKIFGENFLITGAEAEAGCFAPKGNYVMPIAWSCRPPIGPGYEPDKGCAIQTLDWKTELGPLLNDGTPLTLGEKTYTLGGDGGHSLITTEIVDGKPKDYPPPQIYIVMNKLPLKIDPKDDSDFVELICVEDLCSKYATPEACESDPFYPTALTCDLDGDGKYDIEGGGNRGWLDLTGGGGGAAELRKWVKNPIDFPLSIHTWLSGEPGAVASVYADIKDYRQGDIVLIPVFNSICSQKDITPECIADAHKSPWDTIPFPPGGCTIGGTKDPRFHIVAFDVFYISCVHTAKKDDCPGFNWAQELNNTKKKDVIKDNTLSVEGFFITGYPTSPDLNNPCSINLGNCIVSLSQ